MGDGDSLLENKRKSEKKREKREKINLKRVPVPKKNKKIKIDTNIIVRYNDKIEYKDKVRKNKNVKYYSRDNVFN